MHIDIFIIFRFRFEFLGLVWVFWVENESEEFLISMLNPKCFNTNKESSHKLITKAHKGKKFLDKYFNN